MVKDRVRLQQRRPHKTPERRDINEHSGSELWSFVDCLLMEFRKMKNMKNDPAIDMSRRKGLLTPEIGRGPPPSRR